MRTNPPPDFEWRDRWHPIGDAAVASSLLAELVRETSRDHWLYQRAVAALAMADDDDVLFLTNDPAIPLAIVHLTWRGGSEPDPSWPATELFCGWEDWKRST